MVPLSVFRQYGTIQEIWVQLQYAYQETMDNSERILTSNIAKDRYVQSPFPNVFFSAPEVVDIRGFCPSSNMKCRGYMTDQHQPYGGSRNHVERVWWNNSVTRSEDAKLAFGANQVKVNFSKNRCKVSFLGYHFIDLSFLIIMLPSFFFNLLISEYDMII